MALTQKEISHNCYKRRKDNGLCPRCGKPLDRIGHYCTNCLKNQTNIREKFVSGASKTGFARSAKKTSYSVMSIFARNVWQEKLCTAQTIPYPMKNKNNTMRDSKNSSGRCTSNEKNKVFVPVVVNVQRQSLKPNVQYA